MPAHNERSGQRQNKFKKKEKIELNIKIKTTFAKNLINDRNMINSADKYINPFTDFGFKKLFGTEMNKDLLMDFPPISGM